ncbi:MAG TPA: SRPBCC domain-containing protein, partial [Candidatus Tumulicola sp.]|nr:SRPBCC domain-containing protein [Candidatus Tumulicola sp.]
MTSKVFLAIRVPAEPARAFEAFTTEIAAWWRPDGLFRITPGGDGRLAFEAGVGGRLYTTLDDGEEFEIGRISVWEPGSRLVFAWRHANFAPDQSTEVEVCFEAVGDETRVSIEHRA